MYKILLPVFALSMNVYAEEPTFASSLFGAASDVAAQKVQNSEKGKKFDNALKKAQKTKEQADKAQAMVAQVKDTKAALSSMSNDDLQKTFAEFIKTKTSPETVALFGAIKESPLSNNVKVIMGKYVSGRYKEEDKEKIGLMLANHLSGKDQVIFTRMNSLKLSPVEKTVLNQAFNGKGLTEGYSREQMTALLQTQGEQYLTQKLASKAGVYVEKQAGRVPASK